MTVVRKYKSKDVEMLIVVDTMIDSAIAHQTFLQSKRSTWTILYFQNIKTEIDHAVQEFLGQDNAKELRAATIKVIGIQYPALSDLTELKIQIDADFNDEPLLQKEILNTLGFKAYYADAKNKDQEALIDLLYQFKTNLTPDITSAITSKGTSADLLDKIREYADELKSNNVKQEGKKGSRKELTDEAIIVFNNIYNKVINIAKIATNFYKDNQAVKEQFSFNKVKNNLNNTKKNTDPTP
jgi:predicted XRE-type DNA-binding protein